MKALRIVPSVCLICHAWPAQPLCPACLARFAQPRLRCSTCASILPSEQTTQCGTCLRASPPLHTCLATLDYAYPWSSVIAEYKFEQHPALARVLANCMQQTPGLGALLEQADVVLPIPLSLQRLQQRGFNQALELAKRLAPHKVQSQLLLRIKDTPPQYHSKKQERFKNVAGAFAVHPLHIEQIRQQRVLLIDDVMTSGASLFTAADTLLLSGAASVSAVVLARTPL